MSTNLPDFTPEELQEFIEEFLTRTEMALQLSKEVHAYIKEIEQFKFDNNKRVGKKCKAIMEEVYRNELHYRNDPVISSNISNILHIVLKEHMQMCSIRRLYSKIK